MPDSAQSPEADQASQQTEHLTPEEIDSQVAGMTDESR
jgi:hypothetical protein